MNHRCDLDLFVEDEHSESDIDLFLEDKGGLYCLRRHPLQSAMQAEYHDEPMAQAPHHLLDGRPQDHLVSDIDDEGLGEDVGSPTTMSIEASVREGVIEYGRLYPNYGRHPYGLPIDDDEQKRMDIQHAKHKLILGKQYLAPLGPAPQRILDLATGTGTWAMEVADETPSAEVIGVDIAPIAPSLVPPNCSFEIEDIERTWSWGEDSFDFVHLREPLYCIRNWERLMRQSLLHLRPGGWVEVACTHMSPVTQTGNKAPASDFTRMCDTLLDGAMRFGTNADVAPELATYLRNAGFVNVVEHVFQIPTTPCSSSEAQNMVGTLEMLNLDSCVPALGLRVLGSSFGWTEEQTEARMSSFKKSAWAERRGVYFEYFVVYGQKAPVDV